MQIAREATFRCVTFKPLNTKQYHTIKVCTGCKNIDETCSVIIKVKAITITNANCYFSIVENFNHALFSTLNTSIFLSKEELQGSGSIIGYGGRQMHQRLQNDHRMIVSR